MRYEWDEAKNRRNQRKHGISFETAALVFEDEHCLIDSDRIDENTGEERWHAIGIPVTAMGAVLLVVHVYRRNRHDEETIRIISAREADQHDIRRYQAPENS